MADPVWRLTVARAVASNDASALPLRLSARVLDRYLERPENRILRTNTVGRLLQPGKSTIDFGMVADDQVIHLRFTDLIHLVPERERDHWLDHLLAPELSHSLLRMQLSPEACHDDGELRDWRPEPSC